MKSLIGRIKDKIAYECESFRMAGEALEQHAKDNPFPPLLQRARMSEADLIAWRKEQKRSGK